MRDVLSASIVAAIGLLGLAPFQLHAQGQDGQQITKQILATWGEANKTVQTLKCEASLDSFFPQGVLSNEHNRGRKPDKKLVGDIPSQDTLEKGGKMKWAIDFAAPRILKERHAVTPQFHYINQPRLLKEHSIHIFAQDKYRIFRPRPENWTDADRNDKKAHPDATFYEDSGLEFLLAFSDLPLMWHAGGVTGELLLPSRIKSLQIAARWSYRGEVDYKGVKCHILSTPNQESTSSDLEFWIGQEKGFPIRYCQAKHDGAKAWQIEVDYAIVDGGPKMTSWTYTEYDLASQVLKSSQTFKIATLTTNEKLNDELFNHTPKEGMTIVQSKNAEVFQVAADGSLVPFTPSQGVHRRWFILSGLVIFASILAIFVIRRSHRKSREVA